MAVRQETTVPDTKSHDSVINAELEHEKSLRYFLERTELGVLTPEQMAIISLVEACETTGLHLPATKAFFEKQRQLSSGEEGKGRVQAKEVITAGAFPMSLLFGKEEGGIGSFIRGLMGKKTDTPAQKGM